MFDVTLPTVYTSGRTNIARFRTQFRSFTYVYIYIFNALVVGLGTFGTFASFGSFACAGANPLHLHRIWCTSGSSGWASEASGDSEVLSLGFHPLPLNKTALPLVFRLQARASHRDLAHQFRSRLSSSHFRSNSCAAARISNPNMSSRSRFGMSIARTRVRATVD